MGWITGICGLRVDSVEQFLPQFSFPHISASNVEIIVFLVDSTYCIIIVPMSVLIDFSNYVSFFFLGS